MLRPVAFRVVLTSSLVMLVTSCTLSDKWKPNERAGLGREGDGDYIERLISVPLNPGTPEEGFFDLYYLVNKPADGKLGRKTVLFCAGGPGRLVQPDVAKNTIAHFFIRNGYNVVYFHLRGSGFSQIPQSLKYDRYLRTDYAVEDIERIRQDFLGNKKWAAIIGWSYGTVLAQQYAASRYKDNVEKLVLIAPLSDHKEDFSADDRMVRRETLEKIYQLNDEFEQLRKTGEDKKIIDQLFGADTVRDESPHARTRAIVNEPGRPNSANDDGVLKKIEDAFGSEQYVIDEYCELKDKGELLNSGLGNYSRNFFRKLREIRNFGWRRSSDAINIGKVIAVELNPNLEPVLGEREPDEHCSVEYSQGAQRLLYAMRSNDGFLSRIRAYLRAKVNRFRERIGFIVAERTERWDPAKEKFRHSVPTLILKGGADPVTAGGQPDHYYRNALRGPRSILEFPGIGHELNLPDVAIKDPFLSGTMRFHSRDIPPGVHRLMGWTDGLSLYQPFELIPPEDLKSRIELVNRTIEPGNVVTAVILNKGTEPLPGGARAWTVSSPFFTATVLLNPGPMAVGQTGKVSGTISEPKVYKQIELVPPMDLNIDIVSAYFRRNESEPGRPFMENRVTAIFRNKGPNPLPAVATNWTINNPFFTGTVQFPASTEIPVGKPGFWEGMVTNVKVQKHIELVRPEDFESQLEVMSASLDPENENRVSVTIKNTGDDPVRSEGRNWSVRGPSYTAVVRLEPAIIPGKETVKVTGTIKNVKVKPQLHFDVEAPNLQNGLIYTRVNSIPGENTLSVLVFNNLDDPMPVRAGAWKITGPFFTASVVIEQQQGIPSKTQAALTGKISKVELNELSTDSENIALIPPNNLDFEFLSGSERIEPENSISMLVWNKGTKPLRVRDIDWIYVARDHDGTCQGKEINARSCLIYTFVAMEFLDFRNKEKNKIFEAIQEKFDNEATIKHCPDDCE